MRRQIYSALRPAVSDFRAQIPLLQSGPIIVQAMYHLPANSTKPAATAQPLLIGAHVRLHSSEPTGVVIGYSRERDRLLVRWFDTGEVTSCLRAKLAPVR